MKLERVFADMKMKIGMVTDTITRKYPDEREAVRRYAEMGFEALDYSFYDHCQEDDIYRKPGWEDYARELKDTADSCGICFSQIHAPMYAPSLTPARRKLLDEMTVQSFRVAELLGAPYVVIHPVMSPECINGEHAEELLERNVERYREMIPLSERHQVMIALENMFGWDPKVRRNCRNTFSTMEEMLECIRRLESGRFVVCLDTGHCNLLREPPALAAKKLGKHLKLLHVHDNWGSEDEHMAPCFGNTDWHAFLEALKEIGYDGVFSSEADSMGLLLPKDACDAGAELVYKISDALLREHGLR